jgi:hypothetical protein
MSTDAGEIICTVTFARRPDGGMCVFSDDLPGLILSHSDPDKVAADVWPAIKTLIGQGATRRTPAPEGEAVAWRYRYPNESKWQLTLDRKQAHDKTGEAQPLYASPVVPVGVRERVLDELDKAWLHGQRRTSWRRDESADAILAALRFTDTGRE